MLQIESQPRKRGARKLSVALASSENDILAAQKLRYRVFADELGARLNSRTPGVDHDIYDPYCEHLVVRDDASGSIVGTYRILSPLAAQRIGGEAARAGASAGTGGPCVGA